MEWLPKLRSTLALIGPSPTDWDIYRGDSFQLVCAVPDALKWCLFIKCSIREIEGLDVRMAVGIGEVNLPIANITEASGLAFILSGHAFDQLKQNIAISTGKEKIDEQLNLLLQLALISMDNWSVTEAQTLRAAFLDLNITQMALAAKLQKSQSTISATLKRSGYEAIKKLEAYYRKNIWSWIS
ncbi:MAG: transcriptional regulator [Bacteroidia bacterium]